MLARYGASLGKVFFAEYGAYNVALAKVLFNFKSEDFILKKYLFYYFKSELYQNFVRSNSRSAQAGFNKSDLNRLVFPVPPISEQKRIAAKIAQLFALLRKVESSTQQYAELQTLLKSKVLDLAMRGKLVKQDPNDEPASVLLEKIKAEKAELVKEKKIKKSKPLPPITDEEKPFDIPDNWEWVRVGNIINLFNGKAFKPSDWSVSGLPIVRIQNLNNAEAPYHYYNGQIEERFYLKGGELLFSWSGTPGTSFGAHIWRNEKAVLNQHIFKLIFDMTKLNKKYLAEALDFRVLTLINEAHGSAGLRHITKKMFEETIIPIPPLEEQKRIVNEIAYLYEYL